MKKDSITTAFENGWIDRVRYGLPRREQLYRRPWTRRVAWRFGWELANLVTAAPLRTAKKR